MKIYRDACLVALLAVSSAAFGECPKSSSLGAIDAALDFCIQVNPQNAREYLQLKERVIQGVTVKEVSSSSRSSDYRAGYDAMRDAFEKMPRGQAIQACTGTIQTKK